MKISLWQPGQSSSVKLCHINHRSERGNKQDYPKFFACCRWVCCGQSTRGPARFPFIPGPVPAGFLSLQGVSVGSVSSFELSGSWGWICISNRRPCGLVWCPQHGDKCGFSMGSPGFNSPRSGANLFNS